MAHSVVSRLGVILTLTWVISGCSLIDDDDDGPPPAPAPEGTAQARALHASPDAPPVDILAAGERVIAGLPYKAGSEFLEVVPGTIAVQVEGIVPDGLATVIGPLDLIFEADTEYSIVAVGRVADIDALVISNPISDVSAGSARAQVVHAAPDAPAVDVYVTAPDADLAAEAPLGSFAFTETLGPVEVVAGDYQIRVTAAGDLGVLYDSGTVTLADGADLLVAAVENTGRGDAPITLVALDGSGFFEIPDRSTPAALRVVHASFDTPAVDVVVDDDFAMPLIEDLSFPDFTDYAEVPPATYNVKVTAADNAGVIAIDADLTLEIGREYTVAAVGTFTEVAPLVLVDENRSIATQASVRLIHGASTVGLVDIYVTEPGADITDLEPAFAGVDFQVETGYVALAGGDYDITITPSGLKEAAIGPLAVTLVDGGIYTAIARDPLIEGLAPGVILLDDFTD